MTRPMVIAMVALVALSGGIGWAVGSSRSNEVWLSGAAHTSPETHEATIQSGGWSYGVDSSVPWIDTASANHDHGWPTCLQGDSTVRILVTRDPVQPIGLKPVLVVDCR